MTFLIVFLVVVLLMFVADIVITSKIFEFIFQRSDEEDVSYEDASDLMKGFIKQKEDGIALLNSKPFEALEITSKDGLSLKGTLYRLHENNNKVILSIHGYHGNGLRDMGRFAKMYENLGYDLLLIDQRACGLSEGHYVSFGYHEQEDGILWCQKLVEIYGQDVEIVLHGMSMGGATVCNMAGNENLPKQVVAVVSDCSYDSMKTQLRHSLHTQTQLPIEFTLWLLDIFCKKNLHFNFKQNQQVEACKKASVPMLFIHGDADDYVPYAMQDILFVACASAKKKQLSIPNAKYESCYVLASDVYEKEVRKFLEA